MARLRRLGAAIALCGLAFAPLALPASDDARGVSPTRLANAGQESDSWLTYGRDLSGRRYSPLKALDANTVANLSLAWTKTLGPPVSMEGTPIVAGGLEYVTTGDAALYALDAVSGKTIWSYHYPLPTAAKPRACCNVNNRGVTLIGDEVVLPTLDAHLLALDAKTGNVRWNVAVAPNEQAYSITSPPLPVKNMVVTGVGGGEYPTRGFIAAYNARTGALVWRRYTVPAAGEPGSETWKTPGAAARGGGPTWLSGSFDPKRNAIYWGVGNPNPDWDANFNKGDLLYTSSILALDADTGKIKWHYQTTPHNIWDYDATSIPMLVDLTIDGTPVAAIAHADRNGYLYVLNRDSGKLIYAEQYLDKVTWAKVDRTSGAITLNADMQAKARARLPYQTYPSILGGTNWQPPAYDAPNHVLFIPALESSSVVLPNKKSQPNPKVGALNFGGLFKDMRASGSLTAIDLTTGRTLWKKRYRAPLFSGVLATAGGLVFVGTLEGQLEAVDSKTGKTVWHARTVSGINAAPITFSIKGEQYVSVESGIGGVWALYFLAASTPFLTKVPGGSAVYTYKISASTAMNARK